MARRRKSDGDDTRREEEKSTGFGMRPQPDQAWKSGGRQWRKGRRDPSDGVRIAGPAGPAAATGAQDAQAAQAAQAWLLRAHGPPATLE
ncbi:hypothetical protein E4U53_000376 [Claviceps sorghi]|nr:hypothetical protein E4U53_000376 [Claviceps sorghi]